MMTVYKLENASNLDPLLEHIGDARYVLLGEASHGTSEFYAWRTEITKRLIAEKDFSFVAVEGDWPDCYRVNRYVKGMAEAGSSAFEVLHAFSRWPTWMWANREIIELVGWLRFYNDRRVAGRNNRERRRDRKATTTAVGFYGLDVYSLWESLDAVMQYLKKNYPDSLKAAINAYSCFEPYGRDVEEYARATAFIPESCEDEVVEMLVELRQKGQRKERNLASGGYKSDEEEKEAYFDAEQNAVVAKNAELYYRTMMKGSAASWNVRDHHMMNTLERLMRFHGSDSKCIVWAHNTHVGDARATDMQRAKMVNLGQLAREQAGHDNVVLVGFGTYEGTVIAAKEWGEKMEKMPVPPAIDGSWDSFLHKYDEAAERYDDDGSDSRSNNDNDNRKTIKDKLFIFSNRGKEGYSTFLVPRGQRAIGVVYNPSYERYGNYVETILPERYDALLFIDKTNALRPIHMPVSPDEELPETFPTGA
jgi:erythromycin esterase